MSALAFHSSRLIQLQQIMLNLIMNAVEAMAGIPENTQETPDQQRRECRAGLRPTDYVLDPVREPPIGSHIVTPRQGYTHHGIYVGERRVVQYGGLSRGLRRGPVEEVSLSQFAQGREIRVRSYESSHFDREEVICRARLRLGEDRYHPLKNNCEHFCEWCVRGEPRSYQVEDLTVRCSRAWPVLLKLLYRLLFEQRWLRQNANGSTQRAATEHLAARALTIVFAADTEIPTARIPSRS